jgi:thiamine biosynthesis protein ThiS
VNIVVNGEAKTVPDGLDLRALIEHLGLGAGPVAIERNDAVVPRAEHAQTVLHEGDRVEIVHFVGGG